MMLMRRQCLNNIINISNSYSGFQVSAVHLSNSNEFSIIVTTTTNNNNNNNNSNQISPFKEAVHLSRCNNNRCLHQTWPFTSSRGRLG
jgi:hypothetical protein